MTVLSMLWTVQPSTGTKATALYGGPMCVVAGARTRRSSGLFEMIGHCAPMLTGDPQ
jgi:hypothetical protein